MNFLTFIGLVTAGKVLDGLVPKGGDSRPGEKHGISAPVGSTPTNSHTIAIDGL